MPETPNARNAHDRCIGTMKLTTAQRHMLLTVYEDPEHFALYGSGDFRCARNLQKKGLVHMNGWRVTLTPEGEGLAHSFGAVSRKIRNT
jgi:hypothetical protein